MNDSDSLLGGRFAALAGPHDEDWLDVRRRARRLRRRRWFLVAAVAAAAVAVATPALGLHGPVIDFLSSEPAPQPVQTDFASLDVGAPKGMAPGVVAGQTRKVMTVRLSDGPHTLWVAPTRSGGFCELWSGLGGGCRTRETPSLPPGLRPALRPWVIGASFSIDDSGAVRVIAGSLLDSDTVRLELEHEDGRRVEIPFAWVSSPIDAGFYVHEVKSSAREEGHRPTAVVALDAHGDELARQPIVRPDPGIRPARDGIPAVADRTRKRRVTAITTEAGREVAWWVAPRLDGRGQCYWLTTDGRPGRSVGCPSPGRAVPPLAGGLLSGSAPVLFAGQAGEGVAAVELRFEDSVTVSLRPVEGFVLYEIPAAQYARGHRLEFVIARGPLGNELARWALDPGAPGTYPCDEPADLGHGVRACP